MHSSKRLAQWRVGGTFRHWLGAWRLALGEPVQRVPVGRSDYWVVMLDTQYRYSVVSEPSRNYLWILSRTPVLERTAYEGVLIELQRKGYPVENLVRTAQRPDVTSGAR